MELVICFKCIIVFRPFYSVYFNTVLSAAIVIANYFNYQGSAALRKELTLSKMFCQ
jgi:hypothetical protein